TSPNQHQPNLHRHTGYAYHCEQGGDTSIVAQSVHIGGGDGSEAAHDRCDDPIERCHEEEHPLIPDAREPEFDGRGSDTHRLVGRSACPEGMEYHRGDAELSWHEVVIGALNSAAHPSP